MKTFFETGDHSSMLPGITNSSTAQQVSSLSAKQETAESLWYCHTMPQPAPAAKKKRFMVRVSPFSLMALFMIAWLPYGLITGKGIIQNTFLELILLLALFTYTLYADFIIRNFFQGKEKLLMCCTESTIAVVVYCWIFNPRVFTLISNILFRLLNHLLHPVAFPAQP